MASLESLTDDQLLTEFEDQVSSRAAASSLMGMSTLPEKRRKWRETRDMHNRDAARLREVILRRMQQSG